MADKFNIKWFETSAKTGQGVDKTFAFLSSEISRRYEKEIKSLKEISLKGSANKGKRKGCC